MRPKQLIPLAKGEKKEELIFIKIASGPTHCAAIEFSGQLFTWGDGSYGGLGHREARNRASPTLLYELNERRVELCQIPQFLGYRCFMWG